MWRELRSSSPAEVLGGRVTTRPTDPDSAGTPDTAHASVRHHRRWRLGLIVAVVFVLLVVAITVLSVWFEMIMYRALPAVGAVATVPVPASAPPLIG
jgi:type VI protein secretion system component VasF